MPNSDLPLLKEGGGRYTRWFESYYYFNWCCRWLVVVAEAKEQKHGIGGWKKTHRQAITQNEADRRG
jgi:hypothetical protein